MTPTEKLALEAMGELVSKARVKHPVNFHNAHEGWAVLYEEVDELWDEVRKQKANKKRMRKEALQVAAMALRFIEDVCGG